MKQCRNTRTTNLWNKFCRSVYIILLQRSKGKMSFGFCSGRVNFFSVVSWIQCENSANNTLIFCLLLSSVYAKLRTFFLCLTFFQWGGAGRKTTVKRHSQDRWPKVAKYWTLGECHAWYINWRSLYMVLWDEEMGLNIGQRWAVVSCISCSLFFSPSYYHYHYLL